MRILIFDRSPSEANAENWYTPPVVIVESEDYDVDELAIEKKAKQFGGRSL